MRVLTLRAPCWAASVLLLMAGCAVPSFSLRPSAAKNAIDPRLPVERLMGAAQTFERQGKPEKAKQLYAAVLSRSPQHEEATRRLEDILMAERRRAAEQAEPQVAQRSRKEGPADAAPRPAADLPRLETQAPQPLVVEGPASKPGALPAKARDESLLADQPSGAGAPRPSSELPESIWNTDFPAREVSSVRRVASADPVVRPAASEAIAANSQMELTSAAREAPKSAPRPPLTALCPDAPPAILQDVRLLDSRSALDRKGAAAHLGLLGRDAEPALPALAATLEDPDPMVRAHAALAVWQVARQSERAVPVLSSLLQDPNPAVRTLAAYQLGVIGPEAAAALPALGRSLASCDVVGRVHVAEAMARIDPTHQPSIEILLTALQSDDPDVHTLAAFALAGVVPNNGDAVVHELTSALRRPEARLQSAAALALGSFGAAARPATPELVRLLDSHDPYVREAASISLACIQASSPPRAPRLAAGAAPVP